MIGLVTCYWVKNYGSALQSYATQAVLDKLGIENETLKYLISNETAIKRIGIIIRKLRYPSVRKAKYDYCINRKRISGSVLYESGIKARVSEFDSFIYAKIRFSRRMDNKHQLKEMSKKYTAVIVGSDQLWLPENVEEDYYTLSWVANGVKRISYATSFGVASIPKITQKKTAAFLMNMDSISVRETSGASIVNMLTGKTAEVVLDPTLLLTQTEWEGLNLGNRIVPEKYIFCYFMARGDEKRNFANHLKKKTGFKIVVLRHLDEYIPDDEAFGDIAPYNVGPVEFINLVKNAEFVCTDSFHGTVFSIISHRQFFVFNRYSKESSESTNTRLTSLLHLLDLENRMMINDGLMAEQIDYEPVELRLNRLRESSLNYLKRALNRNIS